jgi:4-hydroxy-L-threonine phosphate dehydrogenase PdxA
MRNANIDLKAAVFDAGVNITLSFQILSTGIFA